ncbi:hypothetical protein [Streptomyces radicis]|uniref:Uncharacterized protein n=1 Tax=Streptomyces radicis TaxID=1750517 RepID=A0A3A9WBE9_9ACTN|nr:hypothetical protein [Streptomyces radicis]RKN10458.1 hypothetical protein D7319_08460 [Streptomyces radicis]RKN24717.1 hypothetical protein D7318_09635 [Streptomyces radicis]
MTGQIRQVEVDGASIRRGDVLTIGERPFVVLDHASLGDGEFGITFVTGESLSVRKATAMTALRTDVPGMRSRTFWVSRLPAHAHALPTKGEIVAQVVVGCALVVAIGLAVVAR